MMPIDLGVVDLAVAAILILLDAAISIRFALHLHRQLVVASVRMVIQLLLVAMVLRIVFAAGLPATTLAIVTLMILAAAREVAVRPKQRLHRLGNFRIAGIVVAFSSVATVVLALLTAIRPAPWHDARYAVPLMGIVLGSVLNSASVALDAFLGDVAGARNRIEARLALGATLQQALAPCMRDAMRKGLIPIINQMSAAGIITLPGIMTGQMLAGSSGLAAGGIVWLAGRAVGDERDRLRLDRISAI